MEGFGDSFDQSDVDPAADFLAREQNQLAGLEDELGTASPAVVAPQPLVHNYDFGEDELVGIENSNDDSLPPLEIKPVREEPEKIRKWREEQKLRLEEKDAEEEKKKADLRTNAKKELEDWYKNHEEQIAKTKAANRSAERALAAEGMNGTTNGTSGGEWERVATLCDFSGGRGGSAVAGVAVGGATPRPAPSATSRDTARLRSVILQLKQAGVSPRRGPALTNSA